MGRMVLQPNPPSRSVDTIASHRVRPLSPLGVAFHLVVFGLVGAESGGRG